MARRTQHRLFTILLLSLFAIGALCGSANHLVRRYPAPKAAPVPEPEQVSKFQQLLNSLEPSSLHDILHKHLKEKYQHGVYQEDKKAMEVIYSEDADAATSLVELAKRQANGTSTTPTVQQPATPSTQLSTSTPPSTGIETSASTPPSTTPSTGQSPTQQQSSSTKGQTSPSTTPGTASTTPSTENKSSTNSKSTQSSSQATTPTTEAPLSTTLSNPPATTPTSPSSSSESSSSVSSSQQDTTSETQQPTTSPEGSSTNSKTTPTTSPSSITQQIVFKTTLSNGAQITVTSITVVPAQAEGTSGTATRTSAGAAGLQTGAATRERSGFNAALLGALGMAAVVAM